MDVVGVLKSSAVGLITCKPRLAVCLQVFRPYPACDSDDIKASGREP